MTFWNDDSDVAAVVVADGDRGRGWFNLRHVPPPVGRLVAKWCLHSARHRPPWDVIYADELAELVAILAQDQHASEAE